MEMANFRTFAGSFGAIALAALLTMPGSLSAAGGVLTAPDPDWTGGIITCRIIGKILENEMGYKIKVLTMPSGPQVDEGLSSGDLDYACETWPSYSTTKQEYIKEWGGDGSVIRLGDAGIIGASVYYVPRYLVEGDDAPAAGLAKFTDLNDHIDLFKSMETGDKGRLLGCPVAAWECEDKARVEMLGVNYVAIELGSDTAHFAEMKAAYNRKEPFVAYAWEPHWIHSALDLVALELPEHSDELWPATGWPEDITFNRGSPKFVEEHPEAAQLIANSRLTNEQQAPMLLAVDEDGRDLDVVVDEWLAANEDIWRSWLPN